MTRPRDNYETRLVRALLYSADVLPERVSEFLAKISAQGYWDIKDLVLDEYQPLVDHLPDAYVDFVLSYLIPVNNNRDDLYDDDLVLFDSLGLRDDGHFYPPAHVQGPFLRLLRMSENNGLRLIHALANRATEVWREREQSRHSLERRRVPLPLCIRMPSGTREFWGDDRVYLWFRSHSVGPHSVVSALMALEVWMEEQIQSGRDPDELFETVLAGSLCVAVLGVCLGVALAFREKCLKAVLPIVGAPGIWRLDMSRAAQDRQEPFRIDPLGNYKFIYGLLKQRDERPQRAMDVRWLAGPYAFSDDVELKKGFQDAVARFTEDLPFQFEEEKGDQPSIEALTHRMEAYQALGNPANYQAVRTSQGTEIHFQMPKDIEARDNEESRWAGEYLKWAGVNMWAQKALEGGIPPDSMPLSQAVEAAKNFGTPEDFSKPYRLGDDVDGVRLQAIAGVASATLRIDFEWTSSQSLVDWCRNILLAAARAERYDDALDVPDTHFPQDPKVSAGRGLGKLVELRVADQNVREQILELISDPHYQVVQSVFVGLKDSWNVDRCLCWNALSLGLALSCPTKVGGPRPSPSDQEKAIAWVRQQVQSHIVNIRNSRLPELPRVGVFHDKGFLAQLILRIIWSLPLAILMAEPSTRDALVGLADDLVALTIERNRPPGKRRNFNWQAPYRWNVDFLKWVAELAKSLTLEETRQHVLTPVRECWAASPQLTADLLYGYIVQQIGYLEPTKSQTLQAWGEMADWVLDSHQVKAARGDYLGREVEDALSLLVFARYGRFMFDDRWPHIGSFVDVIDKWVKAVGHYTHPFANLIDLLLSEPASHLDTSLVLGWLRTALNARSKPHDFWGESGNGESTSRMLQRLWKTKQTEIKANRDLLQVYSSIVDELVQAGMPLAGVLQQELERRA